MGNIDYENSFDKTTKTYKVYCVLKDKQWHCRECEYTHIGITQIAGGSGIQGLQRGSRRRDGLEITSANHLCKKCKKKTRHDMWTGNFITPLTTASMSTNFSRRVIQLLGSKDIIENTTRIPNQLTIDHKLPMLRWNLATSDKQTDYKNMSDSDIKDRFQLLKRSNGSVSHNLLKSRSCELCWKTGKRGNPFGIKFYYLGTEKWEPSKKDDPLGCQGCGWYDFAVWRLELNKNLIR